MRLRTRLRHLRTRTLGGGERIPLAVVKPRLAPLRTPADVLNLLEEMTAAIRADPLAGAATKARAVGHLAAVALKAMAANNLAARVEMLEAVLKQRPAGGTP